MLDQLPLEVLELILDKVRPRDLLAIHMTNRALYTATSQPRYEAILNDHRYFFHARSPCVCFCHHEPILCLGTAMWVEQQRQEIENILGRTLTPGELKEQCEWFQYFYSFWGLQLWDSKPRPPLMQIDYRDPDANRVWRYTLMKMESAAMNTSLTNRMDGKDFVRMLRLRWRRKGDFGSLVRLEFARRPLEEGDGGDYDAYLTWRKAAALEKPYERKMQHFRNFRFCVRMESSPVFKEIMPQ